jgi:hypothetical protein
MSKWAVDPNAYYLRYLSDNKLPSEPQTKAMAVGSAFDAFVKAFLFEHIFGKTDPRFEKQAIFEDQVEPHNRDWAQDAGEHLFKWYRHLGALDDLMLQLGKTKGPPKFEMDIRGRVSSGHGATVLSVPFRVKPDLCFVNEHDATVVLDWKVNGYESKSGVSPMKGFVRARRSGKLPWTHDDCKLESWRGLLVNTAEGLEKYNEGWATQCIVGGWCFGMSVGSQFVLSIHQLACRPGVGKPNLTVAEHQGFAGPMFQTAVFTGAHAMWEAINSDWVFRNLSKEDSAELCRVLDQRRDTLAMGPQGFISPATED